MRLPLSFINLDAFLYVKEGNNSRFVATDTNFDPKNLHFRVASITKALLATFYLAKVEVLYPLHQALDTIWPYHCLRHVTPHQLLSMRSGITDDWFDPEARFNPQSFFDHLVLTDQNDFCYANNNYIVLGLLCEHVLKQPLALLLNNYFRDIGLLNTQIERPAGLPTPYLIGREFDLAQLGFSPREVNPNTLDLELIRHKPLIDYSHHELAWAWACGDVVSTPHDMAYFFQQLFLGHLLAPQHYKAMTNFAKPNDGSAGYSLGLSEFVFDDLTVWGHNGGQAGYCSYALYNPNNQRIVVACLGMFAAIHGIPRLEADYLRALAEACTIETLDLLAF
jgi:CubicO group peptidase (beta-lactamase class C family)